MKKVISVLLAIIFVFSAIPLGGLSEFIEGIDWNSLSLIANAEGEVYSGKCGDNVSWSLDIETGELIISGSGAMKDYSYENMLHITSAPWASNYLYINSVVIENGITHIGDYAFEACSGLTSVTIPDSVTSIGSSAFSGCSSLTAITIPDSVTSIGASAFFGCSKLKSITIGKGVKNIGYGAFDFCFISSVYITDLAAWCGISFADYYANPLCTEGNLYINGELATDIDIPDGVTSIGDYAFNLCSTITSVSIPDSVIKIGNSAFCCCSFTSLTIPDSVTSIGSDAFCNCSSLTSVTIPDSVTSIGDDAFYDCSRLNAVYITDLAAWCGISFGSSDANPLYYTHNLYINGEKLATELVIPDSVTIIGANTFYNCNSITSLTIPDSVTSIGTYAFYGCTGLKTVTIGKGLRELGGNPFNGSNFKVYCSCICPQLSFFKANFDTETTHTPGEWLTDSEGSCTASGKKTLSCKDCSAVIETVSYSAKGHTFGDFVVEKMPTCKQTGVLSRVCSVCGEKETLTIAALQHDFSDEWVMDVEPDCTHTGVKSHHCKYCGEKKDVKSMPLTVHSYGEWIIDEPATASAAGKRHKVCETCGDTVNEITARLKPGTTALGKISNTSSGIKISWTAVDGADEYIVYRKSGSGASWSRLAVANVTATSYTDTTVKSGTTYTYTVKAQNESGAGGYNKTGLKTVYLAQPTVKVANKNGYVSVTWGKISGAKGYYVYRKAGSESSWTKIASIGSASTVSYSDKNVKNGTTYKYTVKAYNGSYGSSYCSGVAIKYLTAVKVSSAASAKAGVTVKWSKNASATGYYVYRKVGSGSWTKIATVKGAATVSYLDKTAKKGTTYTYCVRPFNGSYSGTYANTINCKDKY